MTKTTCLAAASSGARRNRPAVRSGPGRLNLRRPSVEAAVADQRDEHDVVRSRLLANASSALVISSRVAAPSTSLLALGRLRRRDRPGARAPRRSALDASASVVPHAWNVLPCSGSPARPTTMRRKVLQHQASPTHPPVAPFGADQRHQRDQDDRHVPQLTLFDRGHAAAGVAHVFGQPARGVRACRSGRRSPRRSAAAAARASSGRSIRPRSAPRGRRRRRCRPSRRRRASRRPSLRRRRRSVLTKVPRYWPSRSPVHCSGTFSMVPSGRATCAITVASFSSTN